MAQADQTVQNATFPTIRADINDNLAALFSANSGNTAPTVTVAYQDWIDTSGTDPIWKKRNAANNAWITLGTIDGNEIDFEGTLPDQTGNAGEFLTTDGTDASWDSIVVSQAEAEAGTSNTKAISPLRLRQGLNASGSAPIYACRAWVNFDGTSNSANLGGTYTRTLTTVTVTATAHGLIAGNQVFLDFTSGAADDGTFTVTNVIGANSFEVTHGTSGSTSGNVTIRRNPIRASGNVSSITDNGTGNYTVNFTTAMPDADYAAAYGTIGVDGLGRNTVVHVSKTTTAHNIYCSSSATNNLQDSSVLHVMIFR